jgi:AraC-like DNA-binding protein
MSSKAMPMEPANTLYTSILLLGAAHGLFLALALVNIKGGSIVAQRLLALLIVTFAADLAVDFLRESRFLLQYPGLVFIESVTSFLYGPLAYLYVCSLTSRTKFRLAAGQWAHFLPFLASIALLIPFYNLSNDYLVELIYQGADIDDRLGLWVIGGLLVDLLPVPLIGAYLTLSIRRLICHGRYIREQFSSIERISLVWLRNLLIALGMLYIGYFLAVLFPTVLGDIGLSETLLNLATVMVIYTIGYLGMRQPVIFSRGSEDSVSSAEPVQHAIEAAASRARPKYERSALDAETSRLLLQELQDLMAAEKPYLDNTLTLGQLAKRLNMSSNYLSQIINEQTGKSFFDYINQHRVDRAKEILADSAQADTSVLTIAMDSGFNSKSAFYTAFKRHTNSTPGQFRKAVSTTS